MGHINKNDSQGILVYPPNIGYQPRYWRRRPTFNGVEENLFDAAAGSPKKIIPFFYRRRIRNIGFRVYPKSELEILVLAMSNLGGCRENQKPG